MKDKDDQHLSAAIKLSRHSESGEKERETSETLFWRPGTQSLSTNTLDYQEEWKADMIE